MRPRKLHKISINFGLIKVDGNGLLHFPMLKTSYYYMFVSCCYNNEKIKRFEIIGK